MSDSDKPQGDETQAADAAATPAANEGNGAAPTESQSAGDAADASQDAPAEPAEPSLADQLAAAKADIAAAREKTLRMAADFDNFRKRAARDASDAFGRGKQDAVSELLPVFDNLERATQVTDATTDAKSMAAGLSMVHKQFTDTLAKLGIERVGEANVAFDPAVHEAIQYAHDEEVAAGLVKTVLQAGYRMGKQLLRPAMVVVSRGPEVTETASADDAADAPVDDADPDAEAASAASDEPEGG